MNERTEARVTRAGMAASVLAAFGASVCCIGPIVAAMFPQFATKPAAKD